MSLYIPDMDTSRHVSRSLGLVTPKFRLGLGLLRLESSSRH